MSAIVWADVVAYDSTLSAANGVVQVDALRLANETVNTSRFDGEAGIMTRLARIYLAAHIGTLALQTAGGSGSGIVSSETYGAQSISISYATGAAVTSSEVLGETTPGRAYLSMVRRSACVVGLIPGC